MRMFDNFSFPPGNTHVVTFRSGLSLQITFFPFTYSLDQGRVLSYNDSFLGGEIHAES